MIHVPFCPDNAILVRFSGSFAQGLLSAVLGRHDGALNGNVAAVTQNQAMHALVFLYKRVLNHGLPGRINAVHADKKIHVPVVIWQGKLGGLV